MKPKFDFNKLVNDNNKTFEKATPAKKRMMIAQDVILRINTNNLKVKRSNFLGFYYTKILSKYFKDVINNEEVKCTVCAKGALFCSLIGRVNNYTTNKAYDFRGNGFNTPHHKVLLKYFSKPQLDAIETAFENQSFLETGKIDIKTCKEFGKQYSTRKECMIAICNNIIKNKGEFIP